MLDGPALIPLGFKLTHYPSCTTRFALQYDRKVVARGTPLVCLSGWSNQQMLKTLKRNEG